jgi:hypothetical protein
MRTKSGICRFDEVVKLGKRGWVPWNIQSLLDPTPDQFSKNMVEKYVISIFECPT